MQQPGPSQISLCHIKYYATRATSTGEYTTHTRTHINNMRCSEMHPRAGKVAARVRAQRRNPGST